MTAVRVRIDVDVTIRVSHEVPVEIEEFDEWLVDHGHVGPSWADDLTDHHPQLIDFLEQDDELLQGLPEPDVWKHDIGSTDIADVEVLSTTEQPQRSPQTPKEHP